VLTYKIDMFFKKSSRSADFYKERLPIRGGRLLLTILLMASLYASLIFNLYNLQIKNGKYYGARAASQQQLLGYLRATRGGIYFTDKSGDRIPAAVNKTYPVIFAVPKEIEDIEESSARLADMLGLEESKLRLMLGKKNDLYELLIKKASAEHIDKIQEAAIPGVYVDEEEYRFYPFGALASQVLGYVGSGSDDKVVGRYGAESFYQNVLAGKAGKLDGDLLIRSTPGEDLELTIDRNIQARAEEILDNLVQKYSGVGGVVIVEEPKSGKILAMANHPFFDPNNYSASSIGSFLNQSVSAVYEPGSIFKIITMASGLDAGRITPETRFFDSGALTLNGKTIKNWDLKSHGSVTMTEVIERSINTGVAFAESRLGHENFYNYLVKFGFKEKTGIDLPGEVVGSLKTLEVNKRDINFATASYGQGVSVTPITLINSFSALANGGVLMRPYLTSDKAPLIVRRVVSEEAANLVTDMMVSAVKKAKIADISKYTVAGKTGTAQVPDFKNGGYSHEVINTYMGYAPATDPRFVILIRLDKPRNAPLAGETVVPAFRELAEFILNYYNVAPDRN